MSNIKTKISTHLISSLPWVSRWSDPIKLLLYCKVLSAFESAIGIHCLELNYILCRLLGTERVKERIFVLLLNWEPLGEPWSCPMRRLVCHPASVLSLRNQCPHFLSIYPGCQRLQRLILDISYCSRVPRWHPTDNERTLPKLLFSAKTVAFIHKFAVSGNNNRLLHNYIFWLTVRDSIF